MVLRERREVGVYCSVRPVNYRSMPLFCLEAWEREALTPERQLRLNVGVQGEGN